MLIFPSRKQWNSWSLPNKLTAIGTYISIISFILYMLYPILWQQKKHETANIKHSAIIDSPKKLLKTFYERVERKEYDRLYELIYPFQEEYNGKNYNYQDLMVEAVKRGDFYDGPFDVNYSHAVMKIILDQHLDKIGPLPKKYLSLFTSENSGFGTDYLLRKIALTSPENLIFFEHNHMKIMMVKIKHVYKILFTADMDNYFY